MLTGFKTALNNHTPIIALLVGVALVSLSIGPFENPDTAWEHKAALGVTMWGMPFVEVQGSLINQPPLGFYLEGLFFKIFGTSITTGVFLMTLFGLGCTLLIYQIGKTLYGKQTGLVASALFALTPWQLVLSNSFLIDTQCLFFSLFSLYTGILAFREGSSKLVVASGGLFALAFYTKLFAVFTLIPLALFYLYYQRKKIGGLFVKLTFFFLPLVLATLVWYTVNFYMMPNHLPKGLGYMFDHSDFSDFNAPGVVPTCSFVGTFLLNYGLGYLFAVAVVASLIVGLAFRKQIQRQALMFDAIFLVPIISIVALTMYLGVVLNLKVPYTSSVKYLYQALPFFSLIAASLAIKCASIVKFWQNPSKNKMGLYIGISAAGILLLILAIIQNMYSANQLSMTSFIIFQVELGKLLGYSFDNFNATNQNSPLIYLQYLGFGLVFFGLIYSVRRHIINGYHGVTDRFSVQ
ncbi:MAG: glycosyltransferase family 39 protein [Candidatus Bathyarchaeota archaeon]|nr:glycosyltransferase family 39 protein [Candidatus Bathyarchaeota archaeon]